MALQALKRFAKAASRRKTEKGKDNRDKVTEQSHTMKNIEN